MGDHRLKGFPGMVLDKAAAIEAIESAPPWASWSLADVRVLEVAPDAAMIAYRAESRRGEEAPYSALMTSTYARRNGRWQLVLHQQSP